jgi:hypothetical protein
MASCVAKLSPTQKENIARRSFEADFTVGILIRVNLCNPCKKFLCDKKAAVNRRSPDASRG